MGHTIERLRSDEGARLRAIRLRALADAPEAFSTRHADAAAWPASSWDEQLASLATFVACAAGRDVGLARGDFPCQPGALASSRVRDSLAELATSLPGWHPRAGHLVSMWVAPEARRQGIGRALIDAVDGWARGAGLERLLLDVGAANAAARALYAAAGFVVSGPGDAPGELRMALRL